MNENAQELRRAFQLGQEYWQQADSESYRENRKASETMAKFNEMLEAAAPQPKAEGWRDIESAPYATPVLAWLYLPNNPPASALVIAQRVYVEQDEPEDYGAFRLTLGCWWANGRYYAAGHVTKWQPLPTPPATEGADHDK